MRWLHCDQGNDSTVMYDVTHCDLCSESTVIYAVTPLWSMQWIKCDVCSDSTVMYTLNRVWWLQWLHCDVGNDSTVIYTVTPLHDDDMIYDYDGKNLLCSTCSSLELRAYHTRCSMIVTCAVNAVTPNTSDYSDYTTHGITEIDITRNLHRNT